MKVDLVLKYISLFTALFISCSCFKLIIYYNQFNLSIVEFLNFQEVITLFIEDIIRYFVIIIIPLIVYSIPRITSKRNTELAAEVYAVVLLIFTSIFFFINKYVSKLDTYDIIILTIIILVLSSLVFFLKKEKIVSSLTQRNISKFDGFFILFAIFLFISTFLYSQSFSQKVKNNNFYIGTRIITKNDTLISTKDSFYIGKTQDYIFYHLKQLNETVIIPKENIVKLYMKSKEYSVPILLPKGGDRPIKPPPSP